MSLSKWKSFVHCWCHPQGRGPFMSSKLPAFGRAVVPLGPPLSPLALDFPPLAILFPALHTFLLPPESVSVFLSLSLYLSEPQSLYPSASPSHSVLLWVFVSGPSSAVSPPAGPTHPHRCWLPTSAVLARPGREGRWGVGVARGQRVGSKAQGLEQDGGRASRRTREDGTRPQEGETGTVSGYILSDQGWWQRGK